MADSEMKAVGLKLKVDGTVDFKKSLTEVNNAVNENRSALSLPSRNGTRARHQRRNSGQLRSIYKIRQKPIQLRLTGSTKYLKHRRMLKREMKRQYQRQGSSWIMHRLP